MARGIAGLQMCGDAWRASIWPCGDTAKLTFFRFRTKAASFFTPVWFVHGCSAQWVKNLFFELIIISNCWLCSRTDWEASRVFVRLNCAVVAESCGHIESSLFANPSSMRFNARLKSTASSQECKRMPAARTLNLLPGGSVFRFTNKLCDDYSDGSYIGCRMRRA